MSLRSSDVISLQSDFINVKCFETNKQNLSTTIYQDYYAFAKKQETKKSNRLKSEQVYNVLMLGIDGLSLSHFAQSYPRSFGFVKDNFWLRYPGFHKVSILYFHCTTFVILTERDMNLN